MNEQTGLFLIGYLGLLLPAGVGFFWMENWLYSKKGATRHWVYVVALALMAIVVAFSFREGPARSIFFATLLPLPGCGVGAMLGGIFGQFFPENHP